MKTKHARQIRHGIHVANAHNHLWELGTASIERGDTPLGAALMRISQLQGDQWLRTAAPLARKSYERASR